MLRLHDIVDTVLNGETSVRGSASTPSLPGETSLVIAGRVSVDHGSADVSGGAGSDPHANTASGNELQHRRGSIADIPRSERCVRVRVCVYDCACACVCTYVQ